MLFTFSLDEHIIQSYFKVLDISNIRVISESGSVDCFISWQWVILSCPFFPPCFVIFDWMPDIWVFLVIFFGMPCHFWLNDLLRNSNTGNTFAINYALCTNLDICYSPVFSFTQDIFKIPHFQGKFILIKLDQTNPFHEFLRDYLHDRYMEYVN